MIFNTKCIYIYIYLRVLISNYAYPAFIKFYFNFLSKKNIVFKLMHILMRFVLTHTIIIYHIPRIILRSVFTKKSIHVLYTI